METKRITQIREMTGLSQGKFAQFFNISVRTVQDWEQGRRVPPPYIPDMMLRILEHEFFSKSESEKAEMRKRTRSNTGGERE